MIHSNGMVAFVGKGDVAERASNALYTLRRRAWHGYLIQREGVAERSQDGRFSESSRWVLTSCAINEVDESGPLLHGTIYEPKESNADQVVEHAVRKLEVEKIGQALRTFDGDYAVAWIEDGVLTYARDPLGVIPLYVARDSETLALASEAKALRSAGFEKVEAVPPGHVFREGFEGRESVHFSQPFPQHPTPSASDEAPSKALSILRESVKRRVEGRKVAVGFSGGLDCSLLAHLASEFCEVRLVSVFSPGSRDEKETQEGAELLALPLERVLVSMEDVRNVVQYVSEILESVRAMGVGIGLAFHLAAKRVRELGLDGLVLGQLADELFGGYSKYVDAMGMGGDIAAWRMMAEDVVNAHTANLERDEKAVSTFTKLLLPYANMELVNYVLPLPASFKLNPERGIRKKLLRRLAVEANLPEELVQKPKKAIQYSSGLQKMVEAVLY